MKKYNKMRKIRESFDRVVVDEFRRMYGKNAADALIEYSRRSGIDAEDVINGDDREMTRFERFAKKNLGIDIYEKFDNDDGYDYTGADKRKKEEDDMAMVAEHASKYSDQNILDFIGSELKSCEWVVDMTYDDYHPTLEMETDDGSRFEIKVTKF